MVPAPSGKSAREAGTRGLLLVSSYLLWLVSAVLGLAGIFAVRRLAEAILVVMLGRAGENAGKWFGPVLIVVTVAAGLVLAVMILLWEDRYRRASKRGFRSLLRQFSRVTVAEVGAILGSVLLTLVLLRFGS